MINCIAIDDEPFALEVIKSFCEKIPYLQLQKTFTQTSEAKKYLKNFPVDLLFLDIQMPDMNGIEFYKSLQTETMVIFTTAFSNYAVEGFNVSAVDYILKPVNFQRFEEACAKAKNYFEYQKQNTNESQFLLVRSEYALLKIPFSEIQFLETMDDYIKIHQTEKKTILTLMSLKKMLEKLPNNEFVRVHRSFIVPLSKIDSVRAKNILIGNTKIPIGSSFEKDFLNIYHQNKI